MSKHRYKFSNKKHSIGGIISSVMALFAITLFVIAIVISFKARGEGGLIVGTITLTSLAFSVFGLIIGLMSYREPDKYYSFSKLGSLVNGIITILMIMLLLAGI